MGSAVLTGSARPNGLCFKVVSKLMTGYTLHLDLQGTISLSLPAVRLRGTSSLRPVALVPVGGMTRIQTCVYNQILGVLGKAVACALLRVGRQTLSYLR